MYVLYLFSMLHSWVPGASDSVISKYVSLHLLKKGLVLPCQLVKWSALVPKRRLCFSLKYCQV